MAVFENFNKRQNKKLLVIGCGGSGTKYISEVLKSLGLDTPHHQIGKDGAVGWNYTSELSPDEWRGHRVDYNFDVILHQIRHPLKVMASLPKLKRHWYRYIINRIRCGEPIRDDKHLRLMYWLYWNKLSEAVADWSYRIEDLKAGSLTYKEFLKRANIKSNFNILPSIPTNTNHHARKVYTWEDFKDYPELKEKAMEYAIKWNYI